MASLEMDDLVAMYSHHYIWNLAW